MKSLSPELRGRAIDVMATTTAEGWVQTSPSHPDFWPANLATYVEALISVGDLPGALFEFNAWKECRFPDGFVPHYMLASHQRVGRETSYLDRAYQKTQVLPNGREVSSKAAPPIWAVAAEHIANALLAQFDQGISDNFIDEHLGDLIQSTTALYDQCDPTQKGLIYQRHKDELSFRDGKLAKSMRRQTAVMDAGVNSLLVQNNAALLRIADRRDLEVPEELMTKISQTERTFRAQIPKDKGLVRSLIVPNRGDPVELSADVENLLATMRISNWAGNITTREVAKIMNKFIRSKHAGIANHLSDGAVIDPLSNLELGLLLGKSFDERAQNAGKVLVDRIIGAIAASGCMPRKIRHDGSAITNNNPILARFNGTQRNWAPTAAGILLATIK